jgi:hypothetical protein
MADEKRADWEGLEKASQDLKVKLEEVIKAEPSPEADLARNSLNSIINLARGRIPPPEAMKSEEPAPEPEPEQHDVEPEPEEDQEEPVARKKK